MTSETGRRRLPPAADLHIHSRYSDGVDSVADLLERADAWFTLISICDHDTIAAYDEVPDDRLHGSFRPDRAAVLPGIEISCRIDERREIHLLGYFPRGFTDRFRGWAAGLAESRRERVLRGVERLREKGVGLRWSSLEAHYDGKGVPCRSHVARALRDVGLVSTNRGAFGRLLSSDDFEPSRVTVEESIEMVRAEGGVPVWAHPNPNAAREHAPRLRTVVA